MSTEAPTMPLTDVERSMLELERLWFKYMAKKHEFILQRFGWTSTVYYAKLGRLIDRHEAEAYDAQLVRRLRRLRDRRRSVRDYGSGRRA